MRIMSRGFTTLLFGVLGTVIWLSACATQSPPLVERPFDPAKHKAVSIEPCTNRTDYKGDRDLSAEATRILMEKFKSAQVLDVRPDAELVLVCDIEQFEEGSALKRWVAPGWGQTRAAVSVMAMEKTEGNVIGAWRSQSAVSAGGLYTIGADRHILSVAVGDIVDQIRTWVLGAGSKKGAENDPQKP